jgi:D-alanine--poly(phosphoribitol) ligase subunit 2
MQHNEIKDKIKKLIIEVTDNEDAVNYPDTNLFDSGMVDSLGLVQLIAEIETIFELDISPAIIERSQWDTTNKIIIDIINRLNAK